MASARAEDPRRHRLPVSAHILKICADLAENRRGIGNLIHVLTRLANLIHGRDCGSFRIFVLIELVAASARMIHHDRSYPSHRVAGSG